MTMPSDRGVPVRGDRWRPSNDVLDSIIRKQIDQAYRDAPGSGGSPVLMAGALVLTAFVIVVAAGTGRPLLALAVAAVVAAAGVGYIGLNATPLKVSRLDTLHLMGGPGNLPAGYLVHPQAWEAGMQEYLADVSDRDLRIAVRLCREHPGSVSDLLRVIRRAERYFTAHHSGRGPSDEELFKVTARMTAEHARLAPARG
jgi:hypothetical protein